MTQQMTVPQLPSCLACLVCSFSYSLTVLCWQDGLTGNLLAVVVLEKNTFLHLQHLNAVLPVCR